MMRVMHRLDKIPNPFPTGLGAVAEADYISDLTLMRFVDATQIETPQGGRRDPDYIVARAYTVAYRLRGATETRQITVQRGMMTDLASVPRPFRALVGRVGRHLEAAIVHDFLYALRFQPGGPGMISQRRRFADELMNVLMKRAQVPTWQRLLIFGAVRLFGGFNARGPRPDAFLDLSDPQVTCRLEGTCPPDAASAG